MAYTVTKEITVVGNLRMALCNVTADAASGTIPTGFGTIAACLISPISMATASPSLKASGGTITVGSAVTGDNFYCVVYGR